MEHLDELSSGIRGQSMGKDMDHPPVASRTIADQVALSSHVPWASFNAPLETLVHLSPVIKQEQDPTSSEFISHSWDLPQGMLLHHATDICTEAVYPDAMPFGCWAGTLWWISACLPLQLAGSPLGCWMVGGNWALLSRQRWWRVWLKWWPACKIRPPTPLSRLDFWWLRIGCHPTPIPRPTIWDLRLSTPWLI